MVAVHGAEFALLSLPLSLPLALCRSVSLSVSICPGLVCKHTLPVSLKTVKARLLQPPLAHSDYNVLDR